MNVPESCVVLLCASNLAVHQLGTTADLIVEWLCQQDFLSLHLILLQDAPTASSTPQLLFCKSHWFLQKIPHASKCQHCSRKPYRDQDMQDTEEEKQDYSPPKLKVDAHLDLFLPLPILLEVQIWTSQYAKPMYRIQQRQKLRHSVTMLPSKGQRIYVHIKQITQNCKLLYMSLTSTQVTYIRGSSWMVKITLQLSCYHRCLLFNIAFTC